MFELRVATPSDIESLKELRHAAFAAHAPSAYSPGEVETLLGDLDEDELADMIRERQFFVAADDGDLAGCAGWWDSNLRHVYVAPGVERRGLGTRLVQHAEQVFRQRTRSRELHVGAVTYAVGFYEANGYQVSGNDVAWDGSKFVRMIKRW